METLVAAVVLIIGVLGTFTMLQAANGGLSRTRAREAATNLARELLEDAHNIQYSQVGRPNWFVPTLQGVTGLTGTITGPTANSVQATIVRRDISYTVTTSWCSVDDVKDNLGQHAASATWCSDSQGAWSSGPMDTQPEDLKRVTSKVVWWARGVQMPPIVQTATFGAGGAAVGPSLSTFNLTQPSGLNPSTPVIASNASSATFTATAAGAADIKFTVNGIELATGVTSSNGTWTLNWQIGSLTDGTYTIGATAIDALGVRGPARTMSVRLARFQPPSPANIVGGYNYVGGNGRLVVEGSWDADPSGSVTGYEVFQGSTSVCGSQSSRTTVCLDPNPPTSGSPVYTVKTWYRDAANNLLSVQSQYQMVPPAPLFPTTYWFSNGTANSRTNCATFGGTTAQGDLLTSAASGTDLLYAKVPATGVAGGPGVVGCLAPLANPVPSISAGTGTGTFYGYFKNTAAAGTSCALQYGFYLNKVLANFGGSNTNGTPQYLLVPGGTASPTLFSQPYNTVARTFSAGNQLSVGLGNFTQAVTGSDCSQTTFYYNSASHPSRITVPFSGTVGSGTPLAKPSPPISPNAAAGANGTTILTWTAPTASNPPVDFYRIYRDGVDYTSRYDTIDATSTTLSTAASGGTSSVAVPSTLNFSVGQAVSLDTGTNQENLIIRSITGNVIAFTTNMVRSHAAGVPLASRTVTWTDTDRGGVPHSYYVTAVSLALAESTMTAGMGPL